ncbi:sperm flagellar protein 1-like [Chelonus insularis]|uniref:sperm flagellar protein 1-like n=1 Tax=Chelonus insularis TaxID=460826 RepID=UPI001588F5AC|nr:sperm flagellar protein 1-like [Chelonus insularis]
MSVSTEEPFDELLDEIYTWLNQMTFSRPRKNLARDFANGVFMAELLKRYYPRYVDLHNYSHTNSLSSKIDNWCTLNKKVFQKINMKISDKTIYQVATCQDKAIEDVLIKVRNRILKNCNDERMSLCSNCEDDKEIEPVDSVLNFNEIRNTTLPKSVFLKLKQELHDKDKVITALNNKITHLESLIKLKNQRIADLSTQIVRSNHR